MNKNKIRIVSVSILTILNEFDEAIQDKFS